MNFQQNIGNRLPNDCQVIRITTRAKPASPAPWSPYRYARNDAIGTPMLKPQASATRELVNLDGLYRFKVDFDRAGHREEWFKASLDTGLEMGVPASYNDIFPDNAIRDHVGYVWYQREVRVPRGWAGRADPSAPRLRHARGRWSGWTTSWSPSTRAATCRSSADITRPRHRRRDVPARPSPSTTNSRSATIPPGSITVTEDGRRQQSYLHDFYNYAGLAPQRLALQHARRHASTTSRSLPASTAPPAPWTTPSTTAGGAGSETVTVSLEGCRRRRSGRRRTAPRAP